MNCKKEQEVQEKQYKLAKKPKRIKYIKIKIMCYETDYAPKFKKYVKIFKKILTYRVG